jgi:hypothetical protein
MGRLLAFGPAFAVAQPRENTHDHNGSRRSRAEMDALGRLRPERARDPLHADGCDNEAYAASHRAGDDHAHRLAHHERRISVSCFGVASIGGMIACARSSRTVARYRATQIAMERKSAVGKTRSASAKHRDLGARLVQFPGGPLPSLNLVKFG